MNSALNLNGNRQNDRGLFAKPASPSSSSGRRAGKGTAGCAGGLAAGLGAEAVANGVPVDGETLPPDLGARTGAERRSGGGEPGRGRVGVTAAR